MALSIFATISGRAAPSGRRRCGRRRHKTGSREGELVSLAKKIFSVAFRLCQTITA